MAIAGAVVGSLAFNIQKYAFIRYGIDPREKKKRDLIWMGGFGLFLISNIGTLIALIYTTQSMIAPLGCIGLVTNAIFANRLNKEKFMWSDYLGLGLCILGSILVLLTGDVHTHEQGKPIDEIFYTFLHDPAAITLTIGLCIILVPIYIYVVWVECVNPACLTLSDTGCSEPLLHSDSSLIEVLSMSESINPLEDGTNGQNASADVDRESSGIIYQDPELETLNDNSNHVKITVASDNDFRKPSNLSLSARKEAIIKHLTPYVYPLLAGCCSSSVSLLVKCFIALIRQSISAKITLLCIKETWIISLLIVFCATSQLVWFNIGLKRYDASIQVPMFHITYTICSVLYGMAYFEEGSELSGLCIAGFIIGVFITCIGSFFLTWKLFHSWR